MPSVPRSTDPDVVMEAAAAFLAVRPRSVDETRRRLRHLGYPAGLCDRGRHRAARRARLPRRRGVRPRLGREPGPGTPAGRVGAPARADAQGHRPRGHRRGPGANAAEASRCRIGRPVDGAGAGARQTRRRGRRSPRVGCSSGGRRRCGASRTRASGARRPTRCWRATASIRTSALESRRHSSPTSSRTRLRRRRQRRRLTPP